MAKRWKQSTWAGCYDSGWKGICSEDSFAHPAKFSRALIQRIYRHLLAEKYITPGAVVVDPFGGVALGALDAMMNGLHWVGVELEPRFMGYGTGNIDQWNRLYAHSKGWGTARLLNGDSRRLGEVLGVAEAIVSSPPYSESMTPGNKEASRDHRQDLAAMAGHGRIGGGQLSNHNSYGQSPGQLGAMPSGDVAAVLSSPPYAESPVTGDRNFIGGHGGPLAGEAAKVKQGYGDGAGNLGNLPAGDVAEAIVTSPPFLTREDGGKPIDGWNNHAASCPLLSADATVSSPPWEAGAEGSLRADKFKDPEAFAAAMSAKDGIPGVRNGTTPKSRLAQMTRDAEKVYGSSQGQMGQESGETFWAAAKVIVEQTFQILKPGGVACWVVKNFVRAGQIQDFSGDWRKLCEAIGFVTIEEVHASLVKRWDEATLFDGQVTRKIERKSFFKRIHEKRRPDLAIDYEVVWIMRKPAKGRAR